MHKGRHKYIAPLTTFCFCFPEKKEKKNDWLIVTQAQIQSRYQDETIPSVTLMSTEQTCNRDPPAELGFGLNVPDTISPRLEDEFPLDLLLHW